MKQNRLYYYGARYYDSKWGIWLGVDLMSDKYPGWSPFTYCLNNPVKIVDPDGNEGYEIDQETGKISQVSETKYYQAKDRSITTVNKGETYHGNDPEVDQVMNSDGRSTYVTHGVMGEKQQNEKERQVFQFPTSSEAKDFYYFAAESSQAEWAYADMKGGEGVVGTDYSNGQTTIPSFFENNNGSDINMISHSHNGSGGAPSIYVLNKKGLKEPGDLPNASNSKYPQIQRQVYDVPGRQVFFYDGSTLGKVLGGEKVESKPVNRCK